MTLGVAIFTDIDGHGELNIFLGNTVKRGGLASEAELFRGHAALDMEVPGAVAGVQVTDTLILIIIEDEGTLLVGGIVAIGKDRSLIVIVDIDDDLLAVDNVEDCAIGVVLMVEVNNGGSP